TSRSFRTVPVQSGLITASLLVGLDQSPLLPASGKSFPFRESRLMSFIPRPGDDNLNPSGGAIPQRGDSLARFLSFHGGYLAACIICCFFLYGQLLSPVPMNGHEG